MQSGAGRSYGRGAGRDGRGGGGEGSEENKRDEGMRDGQKELQLIKRRVEQVQLNVLWEGR